MQRDSELTAVSKTVIEDGHCILLHCFKLFLIFAINDMQK
jgi:hypothetical protein